MYLYNEWWCFLCGAQIQHLRDSSFFLHLLLTLNIFLWLSKVWFLLSKDHYLLNFNLIQRLLNPVVSTGFLCSNLSIWHTHVLHDIWGTLKMSIGLLPTTLTSKATLWRFAHSCILWKCFLKKWMTEVIRLTGALDAHARSSIYLCGCSSLTSPLHQPHYSKLFCPPMWVPLLLLTFCLAH